MAEDPKGGADPKGADPKGGADPTKTVTSGDGVFDPSKVKDEEFEKVFSDPRLFKHSRFKELTEAKQKLDELNKQQAEAEEKRLTEQKKFQELAEKRKAETEDWKNKYTSSRVDNSLTIEATKAGITYVDAALKLVDRSKIKVNDDGSITGTDEAIKALVDSNPYLKGAETKSVGSGTNPPGAGTKQPMKFKASQLRDVEFFRTNEKEILQAMRLGLIEDDLQRI